MERRRKKQKLYSIINKDKIDKKLKKYYNDKRYKLKASIREFTRYHIKERKKCIFCEKIGQRHHPDYSKPLAVIFLCSIHHSAVHYNKIKIPKRILNKVLGK